MIVKKNDKILVIKGKDKGKTGTIEKVLPQKKMIVVTAINIFKKSQKTSRKNPHGGIIDINMPLAVGNIMLICPRCNKATKIGYKLAGKNKLRICKKCHESVDLK